MPTGSPTILTVTLNAAMDVVYVVEQYRLGEIFVDAVVEKKGIDFANLMWERPEYIPTLDEVKQPDLWVARLERSQAGQKLPATLRRSSDDFE